MKKKQLTIHKIIWKVLIFSIIYPVLWNIYFTFSERVRTYYYLPKKKYIEIFRDTKIYRLKKIVKQ